jgi:hypothetical protein
MQLSTGQKVGVQSLRARPGQRPLPAPGEAFAAGGSRGGRWPGVSARLSPGRPAWRTPGHRLLTPLISGVAEPRLGAHSHGIGACQEDGTDQDRLGRRPDL